MVPRPDAAARALDLLSRRFGAHPARAWQIPLGAELGPEHWLIASALLGRAADPERAGAARRALAVAGLGPAELADAAALPLARLLARERLRDPDTLAPLLIRLARALRELPEGSLARLAAACEGLDALGARLVRLAPGFGVASALAFLRPLRGVWPAAREVALDPNARAAALHLGLIGEGDDEEGGPAALGAAHARGGIVLELADAEWALARLGRSACARGATARCALGAACPARSR